MEEKFIVVEKRSIRFSCTPLQARFGLVNIQSFCVYKNNQLKALLRYILKIMILQHLIERQYIKADLKLSSIHEDFTGPKQDFNQSVLAVGSWRK